MQTNHTGPFTDTSLGYSSTLHHGILYCHDEKHQRWPVRVCEYYQDTAHIRAVCSFHTHPELLISILAIRELFNHTLWVLGPYTSIMLMALCVYHHAVHECMHAKDMLNILAVSS
jgi:hypothetical protein